MRCNTNEIELIIPNLRNEINTIIDEEMLDYDIVGLTQMCLQFPDRKTLASIGITVATDNLLVVYNENPSSFFKQLTETALAIAKVDGKFKHLKEEMQGRLFTHYWQENKQDFFNIIHLFGVNVIPTDKSPNFYINKNSEALRHGFVQAMFKLLLLDTGNNEMVKTIYGCFSSPNC